MVSAHLSFVGCVIDIFHVRLLSLVLTMSFISFGAKPSLNPRIAKAGNSNSKARNNGGCDDDNSEEEVECWHNNGQKDDGVNSHCAVASGASTPHRHMSTIRIL